MLINAIERAERGLIDANLGGWLIKQRIPRKGQGRSGGFRTLIAYRQSEITFFIYGFAKNEKENISSDDLSALKNTGNILLNLTSQDIQIALNSQEIEEIFNYAKKL